MGRARDVDLDEDEEPTRPHRHLLRFVAGRVLRHPGFLTIAILASIGVALANIATVALFVPFISSLTGGGLALPPDFPLAFVDRMFSSYDIPTKVRLVAGLLVVAQVIRGLMSFIESRVSSYLKILVERDLREGMFDDLLRMEMRFVTGERVANLQTLLHQYPRQTADVADQYLAALTKTLTGATYLLTLLAISVPLTLLGLALGAISLLSAQALGRAIKDNARITNELRVRLHQTTLESLEGMKLVRVFGREADVRARYSTHLREMRLQAFRGSSLGAAVPVVQGIVNALLIAALLVAASYTLPPVLGDAWVGVLALILVVMMRLATPLQAIGKKRAKILAELPAVEQVMRFLETPKPGLPEGPREFQGLREGVRVERVSFSYGEAPVLHDVDIEIPAGKTTAIIGGSGSGKSTLLHLVSRLADPSAGRILVDGVDLREYNSATWRRRLAFVSQDTFLFGDTIAGNIRFARPEATDEEVEDAARRARAHDFIMEMEDGYETHVGDRGTRLSGGQAQRIAIARALLADPDILILDEATSALDSETELAVQEALEEASRGRTVVVVAHRLSTIRGADRIYVLEAGRVVESGSHEELSARGGAYERYLAIQEGRGGASALPARRIPVQGARPTPPVRVVLSLDRRTALLVNGEPIARELPIVAAADDARQREAARGEGPDVVVLCVGSPAAHVRVAGRVHADVPVFLRDATGQETRVRVRESRGGGTPVLKLHER